MGYKSNKTLNNGTVCEYANIAGYRIDELKKEINVNIGYYLNKEIKDSLKKVCCSDNIIIAKLDLNNSDDILKSLYSELNKIEPYKNYFEENGVI